MKSSEIRPDHLFQKYLQLSRDDGAVMDKTHFVQVNCPACDSIAKTGKFKKNGFQYNICNECHSLFCSPRPTDEQLSAFYQNSESSKYWASVFFPAVAEVRREKLFKKKAAKIAELLHMKNLHPASICDVGAGYGIFLEELRPHFIDSNLAAVEPDPILAAKCREKGFETIEATAEQTQAFHGRFDLVISSEVIEHVYSPLEFVQSLCSLVKPGGSCLMTGLGYEGFDILTLQENSQSVSAPHHINFMSIQGFESLFKRAGFKHVEVTTPGVLDVDIVLKSDACPEYLKVLQSRGDEALQALQDLLSKYKMSSHIWVWAQK